VFKNIKGGIVMPKATQLLRQDHKKVQGLFTKCEQAKGMDAKKRFAMQVMNELEVHAQVEEEIFYPAVKKGIEESELVDEAKQEHQEAKSLIAQLKKMQGQDNGAADEFESKFSELMEAVQHHVEEEEGEMFPKVEDSELDLAELGSEMAARKQELMQEMGAPSTQSGSRSTSTSKSKSKTKTKTKSKSKTTPGKSRSTTARKSSGGKRARAR
jgi:hemerythrin superfamily protein